MGLKAPIHILCVCALSAAILLSGCESAPPPYVETKVPSDVDSLRKLAENGDATAANNLGYLYATGDKLPQDFAEAKKWYDFAIQRGNPAAAYNLGTAYQRGLGTPVNLTEAVKWYRFAADRNFAQAKFTLGIMYGNGIGVQRDDAQAVQLIRSAAIQGLPAAQGTLAELYLAGKTVQADDSLAYQWASLAATKMSGRNQAEAYRLRDDAAKGLSREELSAAQAATGRWQAGSDLVSIFPTGGTRPNRLRDSGSGFAIGKTGEIATDFHVVDNCSAVKLIAPDGGGVVLTRLIADDRANDIALLAATGPRPHLKFRAEPVALGETITTFGYPLGGLLNGVLSSGSVSAMSGVSGNAEAFLMTVPVQPGSSGGPVVDQSGRVVGLVAGELNALAVAAATGAVPQNVNFAWRAERLKALMDRQGLAYETSATGKPRSPVDIGRTLSDATVKIECWR